MDNTMIKNYIEEQDAVIQPRLFEIYETIRTAIPDAIVAFADQLAEYKTSKGAIQLPNNKELPLALIAEIAKWSYEFNKK